MNPKARSERARRAQKFIMDHAAHFAIYASRSAENGTQLARDFAAAGEPYVLVAGGDGTINAVVKGLEGSNTALGILPTGTMNVFAREMGIPAVDLEGALEIILDEHVMEVDLFQANETPFVQMAGVGFDAQVIEETPWERKKALGPLAYLVQAVKVLGDKPPHIKITLDGGRETEGVCVVVGNGGLYGGQFRLFSKADNSDDLLDIIVFKESGYQFVVDSITGVAQGGFESHKGSVEYFQSKTLSVLSDRKVPIEIDGEYWDRLDEVYFTHSASKLKVLAPKKAPTNKWTEILQTVAPWIKTPQ